MPTLKRVWTVDDREDLPDDGQRYEVIDGELFVTPAPSLQHQEAAGRIYRLLADYCERERIGWAVISPADVIFSDRRGVQPDVFVTDLPEGRRPERFTDAGPLLLAVEVLSASTARADRVDKRSLYRDEAVPEYWIIDLDARVVERSTPADLRVDVLVERLEWAPAGAALPFVLDLTDYFSKVLDV